MVSITLPSRIQSEHKHRGQTASCLYNKTVTVWPFHLRHMIKSKIFQSPKMLLHKTASHTGKTLLEYSICLSFSLHDMSKAIGQGRNTWGKIGVELI